MSEHEAPAAKPDTATIKCGPSDSGSCSKGIYLVDQQLVAITKLRGKLLHRMGIQRGGTLYLRLEEAMYLMERGLLMIDIPPAQHTAAASMTELKRLMEGAGIALHDYAVYKELMDASLIVTRHPAQWLGSKIVLVGPAENLASQNSTEDKVSLPSKRHKPDLSAASAISGPAEGVPEQACAQPEHKNFWPTTEPTTQSSHNPEQPLQGAEASSSSVGECRLPDRPGLQPFRQCAPAPERDVALPKPNQVFDVYGGNRSFSRRKPRGILMQVHMSQSHPPSRDSMCAAEAACQEGEAVYHATAAGNHASMYSFQPVCLPDLLRATPQQQKE